MAIVNNAAPVPTNQQPAPAKIEIFKSIMNSQQIRAQLKNSLKDNAGAFMSSMLDLYTGDSSLQAYDPEAVALECVKAAALKLPISKAMGFAYVIPYKGKPTFTVGYKGLIQLAQRTGQYRIINADVVYEGEFVKANKLTGAIDLSGEKTSDKIVGYFSYIELINGFEKAFYMTKEECEAWRDRYSPAAGKDFSPWKTEFDKMALKTVLKRLLSVYGPRSIEMMNVLEEEDHEAKVAREIASNANAIEIEAVEVKTEGKEKQQAAIAAPVPQETIPDPGF